MSYNTLTLAINNGVALITLNRPEAMNTLSATLMAEWSAAYQACEADDAVKVIVVTGAGKAFCAGADMSGGAETFDDQGELEFSSCPVLPAWQLKKPVIAAVNGHAVGIGFSLAMQADIRIVAEQGKYGLLQVRRGVLPDGAMHLALTRLVGVQTTLELMLTGKRMDGQEMVAKGLANQVLPADQVLPTALAMAEDMAANCSPLIMGLSKQLVWQAENYNLAEMEQLETVLLKFTMGKPDALEGGMAYVERRVPQWQPLSSVAWPEALNEKQNNES